MSTPHDENTRRFTPEGVISLSTAVDLHDALMASVDEGVVHLEIDLRRVDMIDSAGLSLIVQCHPAIDDHHGSLTIVNANDDLRALFTLMRLDEHVRIREAA